MSKFTNITVSPMLEPDTTRYLFSTFHTEQNKPRPGGSVVSVSDP